MHMGQALDLVSRYDSLRNPLTSLGDYLDPELISRCLAESGTVTAGMRTLLPYGKYQAGVSILTAYTRIGRNTDDTPFPTDLSFSVTRSCPVSPCSYQCRGKSVTLVPD